jgi:hypothetical protein
MGSVGGILGSLARLRKYVGDRRRSPRRGARFAARLPLSVSPLGEAQDFDPGRQYSLAGLTRDLSARGLTLLLPAMRVGSHYLTDAAGYLAVKVETPSGPVCLLASPARFEHLPEGDEGYGYLLGVRIVRMSDSDRDTYHSYLRALAPSDRRGGSRVRAAADAQTPAESWPDVTPSYVSEAFERFLRNNAHT